MTSPRRFIRPVLLTLIVLAVIFLVLFPQAEISPGSLHRVIAGTNHIIVNKRIAVWNDPSQARSTFFHRLPDPQRRYITSWD